MEQPIDMMVFERIFSDAHIVDVDFSTWDKEIALCVLADHFRNWEGRCPLVVVVFISVTELFVSFPQTDSYMEANKHVQWRVDDCECTKDANVLRIRLVSTMGGSELRLNCKSVRIAEVDPHIIDRLYPGWNRPYSGLIRPGIKDLTDVGKRRS